MRVTMAREGAREPLTAGPRRTHGAEAACRSGRRTRVVRGRGRAGGSKGLTYLQGCRQGAPPGRVDTGVQDH